MSLMRLGDVLNLYDLAWELEQGYIRQNEHPDCPSLKILNYTEKTQFEGHWTRNTKVCRGLIYRNAYIVARPFAKFFNHGQPEADGELQLLGKGPVEVTDKLDGSLGIMYTAPDGMPAIATRGSFTSEQALHATERLRNTPEYLSWAETRGPWTTHMFEIVYPENRIVVDYGKTDDLIYLGSVQIHNGVQFDSPQDSGNSQGAWPGPHARVFPAKSLAEALAMPPRPNAEGIVISLKHDGEGWNHGQDARVKVKQEDYIRLHRLVTGLSERTVWEHLRDNGGTYNGLLEALPDEFHGWVREKAEDLVAQWKDIHHLAVRTYEKIRGQLPFNELISRKDFAEKAKQHGDLTPLLFALLDAKDIAPMIWKRLRPVGQTQMLNRTEDNA